jgi:exonuclease SbcC
MRLHRLCLTAIGPFAGHAEIDFTRLGDDGLFLLEGPTGAGKSTVIDALSFALYGRVAQAAADSERLRSHHAAADVEPVVELVFETHSGIFRIRRTPSHDRPKKRGVGTRRINMTVKLWRLGTPDDHSGGELLSSNISDAEDEITHAVGLTHAQFVQTVVLPQGEFATFLRSSTDSKRALLQRLFGTEVLARTQERLVEGRQRAEKQRASAAELVARAVHAFVGAAEVDVEPAARLVELADRGDHDGLIHAAAGLADALVAAEAGAATRYGRATRRRATAQRRHAEVADLVRRRDRRDVLRLRLAELHAAGDGIELVRHEVQAAERAATALPAAEALAAAILRSEQAQDRARADRGRLPEQWTDADEGMLRATCAALRTQLGELAEDLRRERKLTVSHRELAEVRAQTDSVNAVLDGRRDELADLPAEVVALASESEARRAVAARRQPLQAELARAQTRVQAARLAVQKATSAAQEEQITVELLARSEQQELSLSALRSRWRTGVAGELGLALQVGQECVVCGSVEHPRPAAPAADHVSQHDVDTAEVELARLHGRVRECRERLTEQRRELMELQVAADQLTPEQARARLDVLTAELAEAAEAAAAQSGLDARLSRARDRIESLTAQVHADEVTVAGLTERARTLAELITQDEARVGQARAGHRSVADRVADITDKVERLDDAVESDRAAHGAVAEALERGTQFRAALNHAGFEAEQAWQAAIRHSADLADLRGRVRTYDEQRATVESNLAEPELFDPTLDSETADPEDLAEDVRGAEADEATAAAAHGSARNRAAAATRQRQLLEQAAQQRVGVLLDTAPAIRLGQLVDGLGDNQLRMQLTTYVLVRRFGDVVAAANAQLRRISGGRYELQHTSARSGNSRAGLGLLVQDLHTGRPRDPGTLSGGETFYVSLALALGLADVVRSETGGVDLGTLFIDEGFGALDPEVLDEVLTVLDGLRAGGRTVGIVSHVAELKARIPDRIHVLRNPDGSSRLTVTA